MISAGKLNKRVIIQKLMAGSPERDSYGAPITSWCTVATVWAAIEPISGREFWAQQQVQNEVTIKVSIRYLAGIIPEMRVLYGDRVFIIKFVIDFKEGHKEIQLMCAEGIKDG